MQALDFNLWEPINMMKNKKIYVFSGTSRAANYGIGTYMEQLIKALKTSHLEFNLVYLYARENEIKIREKDGYHQIDIPSPALHHINANRYYMRNVAYLLREIIQKERGIEYIFHLNFMTNPLLVRQLKKLFKCKIILVAHYTNWSFALLGDAWKLKQILGKRQKELRLPVERTIVKDFEEDIRMINRVDKVVCVANHTWKVFSKSKKIRTDKVEIINNALEDIYTPLSKIEQDLLRRKYFIDKNCKIILFAGRLDEVKGIAALIKAFKIIFSTYPDCRLVIVGDGDYNLWLKEATDYWSKITFTGRLDKNSLYELYQIAYMGVVCSLHEEFGFVAIEMMMHALPIIVTKTGGLDEIIEDNESGLKVPVNTRNDKRMVNVKILSEKINFLLEHTVIAERLGINGRKRFLEKYEISTFKRKMLNLYEANMK